MSTGQTNPFSAADPALGYLYQVRSALLWALRRLKGTSEFLVSIETLDDVTFESTGHLVTDLLQTKHQLTRSASLTDASPDLWKTLRMWFEGTATGIIPASACLCLVTTGTAPAGTAASHLCSTNRDPAMARQLLDTVASSSTNQAHSSAYRTYLSTSTTEREAILEKILVIANAPTIADLDRELRSEVYWAVERDHHAAFLDRLEGWWFRRVLVQLTSGDRDRIASGEIEAQMADLRQQFKQDSLPIDDDLLTFDLDDGTHANYLPFAFVRQLDLILAGKRRIAAAIRDYYRAFEQRSRWLRDDLIGSQDLQLYERRLIEEWELVFEAMRDDLGSAAADDAKQHAARSVLAWAERFSFPIRPNVPEPFLTRGSLHMLADEIRIGWHPEFRDHLAFLLSKEDAA